MSHRKSFSNAELNHLLSFIGYGALDAPIWFLGMEEAGGGQDNLTRRLSFDFVEDLASAHRKLGITKHHWGHRVIQPTWRGMCIIMLTLMDVEPTREAIRDYQANRLGRHDGETLLLELMPLPKVHHQAWPYEEFLLQFQSLEDYYRLIKPKRVKYVMRLIAKHNPKAIVCYGKRFWPDYCSLFPGRRFSPSDSFQVSNGAPLVMLTDHFTSRTMNGKFKEVAEIMASKLGQVKRV
jgi:hypothetical protein